MYFPITLDDVIFAAFWAFIFVFIVKVVSRMFLQLVTRTTIFALRPDQLKPDQLEEVMQNCYKLFPIDSLSWDGTKFERGSILRVVNSNAIAIEGKFIGLNDENMLCIMTNNSVIAQEIGTISEIVRI